MKKLEYFIVALFVVGLSMTTWVVMDMIFDKPIINEAVAQSRTGGAVEATVVAENQFTDQFSPLYFNKGAAGYMNVSIYGASAWDATVTLQRRFGSTDPWKTVRTWTENTQHAIIDRERRVQYRLGVATGDFTSGSVSVRLSN